MTEQEQAAADAVAAEKEAADAKAAEEAAKAATGGTDDEMKAELERTKASLKLANKEAHDRRKRLEELEKAEEERKTAALSETDKLRKELEEAKAAVSKSEANAREMLIKAAFVAEAAKAGATHPEDVYLLADRSNVDVNDLGHVEGVAEAVKVLVDAGRVPLSGRPGAPNLNGGAGGGDRNRGAKLTADELEAAHRMGITPERAAAQKTAMAAEMAAEEQRV